MTEPASVAPAGEITAQVEQTDGEKPVQEISLNGTSPAPENEEEAAIEPSSQVTHDGVNDHEAKYVLLLTVNSY